MQFVVMAALALGCGAAYDVVNVRFIRASQQRRAWAAAVYSTLMGAIGLTGTLEALHHAGVIPFLLVGYFVGTFIGVRYGK